MFRLTHFAADFSLQPPRKSSRHHRVRHRQHTRRLLFEPLEDRRLLAAGDLDPTFGDQGKVISNFFQVGVDESAADVAISQSDGKLVMVGASGPAFVVARYNVDGSPDLSFGDGGTVSTDFGSDSAAPTSVVIDGEGRLVVGGLSGQSATGLDFALARYNNDGSLDTSFGTAGKVLTDFANSTDRVSSIAIDSAGRIVAAGSSWQSATGNDFAVVRYNPDGTLDTSFGTSGKVTTDFASNSDSGESVVIDNAGRIVVVGYSRQGATQDDFALVRYNPDGTLDTSFGTGGKVTTDFDAGSDRAASIAIDAAGRIVATGSANWQDVALARYTTSGGLDSTFGNQGTIITDFGSSYESGNSVAIDDAGRIVIAGYAASEIALARYTSSGDLDATFGTDGKVISDFGLPEARANSLAFDQAGRIVVVGSANAYPNHDFGVFRFTSDGDVDHSFGVDGLASANYSYEDVHEAAYAVLPADTDGKFLVVGYAHMHPGPVQPGEFIVAQYNENGTLDTAYGINGVVTTGIRFDDEIPTPSVLRQADGRIVVVYGTGSFVNPSAIGDIALARFNTDGSVDTTFGTNGKVVTDFGSDYEFPYDAVLDTEGRIIVAGTMDGAVVRYNDNGSLDTTFGDNVKTTTGSWSADGLVIDSDGQILVVGNAAGNDILVRLNSDGSFAGGVTTGVSSHVTLDGEGRILVAGQVADDQWRTGIAVERYLPADDSLDSSFGTDGKITNFGFGGPTELLIDSVGRIVVVGSAQDEQFVVARYQPSGDLDPAFGVAGMVTTEFYEAGRNWPRHAILDAKGRIVVVGSTANYAAGDSHDDFALARYLGEIPSILPPHVTGHTPSGDTTAPVSLMQVRFDQDMDRNSFSASDDVVQFVGPEGALAVSDSRWTDDRTLELLFDAQRVPGNYELVLGPEVLSLDGVPLDQDFDERPGEATDDRYTANFTIDAPPQVIGQIPSGSVVGPVSSLQIDFSQQMDQESFSTVEDIMTFTGPAGPLNVTAYRWIDEDTLELSFDAVNAPGLYQMILSPNVLNLRQTPLDQDGNLIGGESLDDQYFATFRILGGPRVIGHAPSGDGTEPVSSITVTFNESIDDGTFTSDDVLVEGPGEPVTALSDIASVSGNQYRIRFERQTYPGTYHVYVGPDIENTRGILMDQDRDGVAGEFVNDRYDATFIITNVPGPQVTNHMPTSPTQGPLSHVDFTFDESVDPDSIDNTDVTIIGPDSQVFASSVEQLKPNQVRIHFPAQSTEGTYTISIGPEITGLDGNLMDQDLDGIRGEPGEDAYTLAVDVLDEVPASVEFNYTITAGGTEKVTVYPAQSVSWTVAGTGTETWDTFPDQYFDWTVTATGTETWHGLGEADTPADPAAHGFYKSGDTWYKNGNRVTQSGVTEFQVNHGRPFWKYNDTYYTNSMNSVSLQGYYGGMGRVTQPSVTSFTLIGGRPYWKFGDVYYANLLNHFEGPEWGGYFGAMGQVTRSGATCFRVIGHNAYWLDGGAYYRNDFSHFALPYFRGSFLGSMGKVTQGGATEFQVYPNSNLAFWKYGGRYYANTFTFFDDAGENYYGYMGSVTQAGPTDFRVKGSTPYWTYGGSNYTNTMSLFSYPEFGGTYSSISEISGALPAGDQGVDPCAVSTATRVATDSGTGTVSRGEGHKFTSAFDAFPAPLEGGTVSGVSYTISDNHPKVTTWLQGNSVYASTEASQTQTATRTASDSVSGEVATTDGAKDLGLFNAYPQALQGGTISGVSYTLSDNNPNVSTWLEGFNVYGNTQYSETQTAPWSDTERDRAAINIGETGVLVATSWLLAPDGDTNWSVTDDSPRVSTWMVGPALYARDESTDRDGLSDEVENNHPNNGDGNNDGTPDSEQPHVASLPNVVDGAYVTFETSSDTRFVNVLGIANPSPADTPSGVDFPTGFFQYELHDVDPGGAVTVTMLIPPEATINTFYKYGAEPTDPSDHWYEFTFDGTTGAEILSDRVVLRFVDGLRGDDDLAANGVIVDPVAPAFNQPPEITNLDANPFLIDEGGIVILGGEFDDSGISDIHTLTVDWGDGLTERMKLHVSDRTFSLTHPYLDNADGTITSEYPILVNVNDGYSADSATTDVTVRDVQPTIELNGDGYVDEGSPYTLTIGPVTDPGDDTVTEYIVHWGDGDTETYTTTGDITHTYADGRSTPTITVDLADEDGTHTDAGSLTVTVENVSPRIAGWTNTALDVGNTAVDEVVHVTADFRDPGFDNPTSVEDFVTSTIDWGDGTVDTSSFITVEETPGSVGVLTTGTVSGTHAYATGGIYEITITLRDDDGDAAFVSTEAYVTGVGVNNGVLQIVGTSDKDNVHIKPKHGKTVVRTDFNRPKKQSFDPQGITSIEIALGPGDDHAQIDKKILLETTIDGGPGKDHLYAGGGNTTMHGGSGNDHLFGDRGDDIISGDEGHDYISGGRGNDLLDGGPGNDLIFGGFGNDILLGGDGHDTLFGGFGDDLVFGGRDSDLLFGNLGQDLLVGGRFRYADNATALRAIQAEWTNRSHNYETRVANIRGDTTSPRFASRLNESFFLKKDGDDPTVLDDEARDILFGGFGRDWFFLDSVEDWLIGRRRRERIN